MPVPPLNITHTSTHANTHSRTHARLHINTHTHTHTHRCRGCLYSSRLCHWKMNVPVPPLKIQQVTVHTQTHTLHTQTHTLHTQTHLFNRSPPPPLILFNLSQCAQSYHYISCPAGNHTNTNTPSSSLFVSPSRSFSFHPTRRVYHCHH